MGAERGDGSRILNVSVRAWIAILLVATVCAMAFAGIEVQEPLHSLSIAAVSFYLGRNQSTKP